MHIGGESRMNNEELAAKTKEIGIKIGRLRGGNCGDFVERTVQENVPDDLKYTALQLAPIAMMFLDCVSDNPGATPSELIKILGVSKGAVSQNARRLIQLDLVTSYKVDGNMKTVHYMVTPDGARIGAAHEAMRQTVRDRERELVSQYSATEAAVISDFLDKINELLA